MGYTRDVYDCAMKTLTQSRVQAELACKERREAFYGQFPRALEIERLLAGSAVAAARAVLNGANARERLTALKKENLLLQAERAQLLKSVGLPENYLEPEFACQLCKDQGFIDGKMCSCFKKLLRIQACKQLNDETPMALCSFDDFSLDYYPDTAGDSGISAYRQMEQILRYCKHYADGFSLDSSNLLMQGGTGLGKTHLSLAIANAVIQKGFGVIYGSAQNTVTKLEKERFQKENSTQDTNRLMLECDLLIIDDLGTEFSTSFVTAAVYNIVNTRLMTQKPTIISTNLSMKELEERYTERFASRILGSYIPLFFRGNDVRQQKRRKK